jgi:ATP-dependent helicase/nuclease subunit A
VHGSKGLQAPIVFLPDTLQVPTKGPKLLWLGEDGDELLAWPPNADAAEELCSAGREAARQAREREYRRLLYVAMTRAEDRLVVCGWKTRKAPPEGCWYNLIRAALERQAETVEDPFLAAQGETEGATVLRLACPQEVPPPPAPEIEAGRAEVRELPNWARSLPPAEPMPPRPLAPSRPDGDEPAARSPLDGPDMARRFLRGKLIHRLLQTLPDLDPHDRDRAMARYLAKPGWGLAAAEQFQIASEVMDVLEDPRLKALFGPGSRAEVPVVGLVGDRAVSGQVDRLVVTDREVLVVDYKTNRRPPAADEAIPELYVRQMAAYRLALACIYPGKPVRCALVWTDGPLISEVEPARMDDALAGMMGEG